VARRRREPRARRAERDDLHARWRGRRGEGGDGLGPPLLARVMVGAVEDEQHAEPGPRGELVAQARPALACCLRGPGQPGAELVSVGRQVVEQDAAAVGAVPPRGVAGRMVWRAVAAPHHRDLEPEPGSEHGERGRMPEGIGCPADARWRGAERGEGAAAGEQVPDERLTFGDEVVGEHVPRSRLEAPVPQGGGERLAPLRAHREVVVEQHRLPVEQEGRDASVGGRRRVVEQLVDESDEALPEAPGAVVPLAVPVRVGDDEHVGRVHRVGGRRGQRRVRQRGGRGHAGKLRGAATARARASVRSGVRSGVRSWRRVAAGPA
jgi:hypothetical protein